MEIAVLLFGFATLLGMCGVMIRLIFPMWFVFVASEEQQNMVMCL